MLGLKLDSNGVSFVTQMNTYEPQLEIYDIGGSAHPTHKLATSTILSYISSFNEVDGASDTFGLPSSQRVSTSVGTYSTQPGLNLRLGITDKGRFVLP
jgi:hypothetical protein